MDLNTKMDRLTCPRCGSKAYLECSEREYVDEDFSGIMYFQFVERKRL